ncbi:M12 family metallopeptidase [Pedobacter frigoris]|uniref:Flavastacin n=1 Tax=Pedobacter frigoris TaxID=2571272 RepID=A0A4U1CMT9_9SPHI|nr:M12 family metallopeptidase [Pedobacter frigoris]TKC08733.1 flavastacin [Pedobacter frigoris]
MKNLIKICMMLLLCATFYACKKNVETSDPVENGAISSSKKGDSLIHKLTIDGKLNYIVEVDGIYYFADDIIISKEQFNTLKKLTADLSTQERSTIVQDFAATWPNSKAYYQYPDPATMTAAQHTSFVNTINTALGNITTATGIQFEERTTQTEYMKFVKSTGNNSPLGWQKNRVNTVNLYNYNHIGITMHEVMHSLGIMHEQCRPDRDQYVIVYLTKVQSGYEHNYNLFLNYGGHGAFDFGSVMLYSSTSFAINNNQPPMTRLDGSTFVGQRAALSAGDIAGLKSLYFPMDISGVYRVTPASIASKSLDIYGGSAADGTRVIIWTSHQANNQRFQFTKVEHGYYQIKSVLDPAKVLTVKNAATASGTQVELRTNANASHQKFKLYNAGNLGFSFAPLHATGLRLELSGQGTADGTNIVVSTSNTSSQAQKFNLTKF